MSGDDLLEQLRNLEVELHQPSVRSNVKRLDTLLHESFAEFGRSGGSYCKADILRELPMETSPRAVWSQDFSAAQVANDVALLTYKSAHLDENGEFSRHTLRSSLWLRTKHGWQMRFHQGTPTDAFAKLETE